jgi:hypothetical protein
MSTKGYATYFLFPLFLILAPLTALAELGAGDPSKTGSEDSFKHWLQAFERPRAYYKNNGSLTLTFSRHLKEFWMPVCTGMTAKAKLIQELWSQD